MSSQSYSFDLVANILSNWELITAFIERVTQEIFPTYYSYGENSEFWDQEGNTLQDRGPHNTRIPKRDQLKENLIIMKADVSHALSLLEPTEQTNVLLHYQFSDLKEKPESAIRIIEKLVKLLNGQSLDYQL